MEDVATLTPPSGIRPVPITDVRAVPLADLLTHPGAHANVSRVMEPVDKPSRIPVAMFQSAI